MISSSLPLLSADTAIDVVISSRNALLTLRSADGSAAVLGNGDLHDGSLSRYERRFTLAASGDNTSAAAFTVSLYPTSSYFRSFHTALPAILLAALVCAIAAIAASVFVLNCVLTRRLHAVSKLVDEFLPRSIQQRLIETSTHRDDGRLVAQETVATMRLRSTRGGDDAAAAAAARGSGGASPTVLPSRRNSAAAAGASAAATAAMASAAAAGSDMSPASSGAAGSLPAIRSGRVPRRSQSSSDGILSWLGAGGSSGRLSRTSRSSRTGLSQISLEVSGSVSTGRGSPRLANEAAPAVPAIVPSPMLDLHQDVSVLFSDFVGCPPLYTPHDLYFAIPSYE